MPTVSVICTARDAAGTIAETIESTIAQTLSDWEMIVVDDGSVDATEAIARTYQCSDSRIVAIATGGIGRGAALNRALAVARADYVANIDADDVSHPQRLELQVASLREATAFHVLSSEWVVFFSGVPSWPTRRFEGAVGPPLDVTHRVTRKNPLSHSSVIFRRDAILAVGGYDTRRKRQFDYDLWVRLAVAGHRLGKIPAVLAAHRIHQRQSYEGRHRLEYLRGSIGVQCRAIRALDAGPIDWAIAASRAVYGLLPQRWRALRSGRRSLKAAGGRPT